MPSAGFPVNPYAQRTKKVPNPNTHRMKIRIGTIIKSGQFVSLLLALLALCHTVAPGTVGAESTIRYFRNDHGAGDRAARITRRGNFAPICSGENNRLRLSGLDLVRQFAGAQTCPGTNSSNRFDSELNHVFLIDDTEDLSGYLKEHLRQQNLLGRVDNKEVVRPGIRTFQSGGRTISFLTVGETVFRQRNLTPTNWFNVLNRLPRTSVAPLPAGNYGNQCAQADVPLPPIWRNERSDNTQWQYRGNLDPNEIIVSPRLRTVEVWAYTNSKGVCVALPRKTAPGPNTIDALGIICQSKRTGKACFWDNRKKRAPQQGTRILRGDTNGLTHNEMQDGSDLVQDCTQCHRGETVFLVPNGGPSPNAGFPLSLKARPATATTPALPAIDIFPSSRYEPIPTGRVSGPRLARTRWGNPAPFMNWEPTGSRSKCNGCHEIPALTNRYCDSVLKGVFEKNLMPPGGGWRNGRQFRDDFNTIAQGCNSLSRPVDLRALINNPPPSP